MNFHPKEFPCQVCREMNLSMSEKVFKSYLNLLNCKISIEFIKIFDNVSDKNIILDGCRPICVLCKQKQLSGDIFFFFYLKTTNTDLFT